MKHTIFWRVMIPLLLLLLLSVSVSAVDAQGRVVVLLDPGHSDGDGGGTYAGNHLECYYNMKIALACKAALEKNGGFAVYLSHPDNDTAATLLERAQVGDAVNADVILSLHIDGSDTIPGMNGAEVFYSVVDRFAKQDLSMEILNSLTAKTQLAWRGLFQRADSGDGVNLYYWDAKRQWDVPNDRSVGWLSDYYGIITWGAKYGIPALIVEHGFMTNDFDRNIIEDDAQLEIMGEADAAALISYYTGHTHKWSKTRETDYPTNCCFAGKASYHCSVCGARRGTVSLAAPTENDHYYIVTAHKDRTCTEDGYTTYTCRIAHNLTEKGYDVGEHSYTEYNYAAGHQYAVTEDRAVTHTEDGIHTEVCSVCGDVQKTVIKAEGHTWSETEHKDASCAEDGYDRRTCSVCGECEETVIPAFGHRYTVIEDKAQTCTEDGVRREVCEICGDVSETVTPARGHEWLSEQYIEAKCEENGVLVEVCTVCGEIRQTVFPAVGHNYIGEPMILENPTFFRDGKQVYFCANDPDHSFTEVLPRTGTKTQIVLINIAVVLLPPGLFAYLIYRKIMERKRYDMK